VRIAINDERLFLTLSDMVTVIAAKLVSLWPNLNEVYFGYAMGGEDRPTLDELQRGLGASVEMCAEIGWLDLARQAKRILNKSAEPDVPDEAMKALVEDFRRAFEDKTHELRIVIIGQGDTDLFMNAAKHLCGILHADLSVSTEELDLAGRCLALGLSTACVAHAMRSAEASLHALSRRLGISFVGSIELQDWKVLTDNIKSEISKLEQQARSQAKSDALKWLSELILPADAFRNAWRNHVAHAREKYEEDEARKIISHVADYLRHLSSGL
jgi:hypothetical protein